MYKIGDKVRVIADLKEGKHYHEHESVVDRMLEYAGNATEIIGIYEEGVYELSCDNGKWNWPEMTLIPYTETNYDKIHNMTDEQLSRFLIEFENKFGEEYEGEMSCLDWLRKPIDPS